MAQTFTAPEEYLLLDDKFSHALVIQDDSGAIGSTFYLYGSRQTSQFYLLRYGREVLKI